MWEKTLRGLETNWPSLLAGVMLLRVAFLFGNGLDLIGDESYYWDWSRRPDWCYYSKPPMIAWLIGAATWLFGDYTAVVRLPAVLLGTAFLAYFYATAKAFYGPRAGAMALLLVLATPANVLANFLMTIDPPLYCFWIMAVYYLRRALFDASGRAWLWAGIASAAAVLSKQAAVILPIMLFVFLLTDSQRRACLRREYWHYLAPLVLAAVPILLWNQQHDWVMFGHSKGHFAGHETVSFGKHLKWAGDFVLYQLLLLSPLICLLVLFASVSGLLGIRNIPAEQRFLWLLGPLPLLVVFCLSLTQKAQGNWPMPFYFTGLILLAGSWQAGAWPRAIKYALGLGYTLVLATYLLPVLLQAFNLKDSAWDPTKRFKSWHVVAEEIQAHRQASQADLADTFVVALGHRYLASQLAFYLRDHPQVFRYEETGEVKTQYEVWPGPQAFAGQNAFIIGETPEEKLPVSLKQAFAAFRLVGAVPNPDKKGGSYFIYLGETLLAWPEPIHH